MADPAPVPAAERIRAWLLELAASSPPPWIVTERTAIVGPRDADALPYADAAGDLVALELHTVAVDSDGLVTIRGRLHPWPR